MRHWVLVLAALAGCTKVFGLDQVGTTSDARAIDAAPDAHNVGVATAVSAPALVSPTLPVVMGDPSAFTTTVHGPPDTYVPFAMTSTAGTFADGPTEVHISPGGTADVVAHLAPTAAGQLTVTAASGAINQSSSFTALMKSRIGPTADQVSGGSSPPANAIYGASLAVPASWILALGFTTSTMGQTIHARIALYTDQGYGRPVTLVGQAGPVMLVDGDNLVPLTVPVQITSAGTYWVVVVCDAPYHMSAMSVAGAKSVYDTNGDASVPFPMTFPVETASTGIELGLFLIVAS